MMPIYFEKHILFNPFSNYEYYLLPSFLPLMLMLFTLLTTIFTIGVELKTVPHANGSLPAAATCS